MSNIVIMNELKGLEDSKAAMIKATFDPMVEMLESFESQYNEVISLEQSEERSKQAKRLRLDIGKIRIETEKNRKSQKEEYLRAGKAIDGVANIVKWAVTEKENTLKEIEGFYERIETERLSSIQKERELQLAKYHIDGTTMDLSGMDNAVYDNLLSGSKAKFEAIREAEEKAEQDRIERAKKYDLFLKRQIEIAPYSRFIYEDIHIDMSEKEYSDAYSESKKAFEEDEAEQERVRLENQRLQKEREEIERKAEAERKEQAARLDAERKAREESDRKAREEREATARNEAERLEKERKEKTEQERIAKEKALKEAEEKRKSELAPDKEKLMKFAEILLSGKDTVKSEDAKKALQSAIATIVSCANGM